MLKVKLIGGPLDGQEHGMAVNARTFHVAERHAYSWDVPSGVAPTTTTPKIHHYHLMFPNVNPWSGLFRWDGISFGEALVELAKGYTYPKPCVVPPMTATEIRGQRAPDHWAPYRFNPEDAEIARGI